MSDTKKIYLFCSAGMSTSILAQKMQEVATDHKLPLEVRAYPIARIDEIVASEHPACVMLGPQVHHQFEDTRIRIEQKFDTPVGLLDREAYGFMDGESCLKSAIKVIKSYKK